MRLTPHLQFQCQGWVYALPTALVKRIFYLPELTPIPEAPGDIVGLVNWQGQILPVMHLAKRLGVAQPLCSVFDAVIVIAWEGIQVGIIVNEVKAVMAIDLDAVDPEPDYGRLNPVSTAFIQGIVQDEHSEDLIILLNPETLIRSPEAVSALSELDPHEVVSGGDFYALHYPQATDLDRAQLKQRMRDLALQSTSDQVENDLLSLAIVQLGEEQIGIPLAHVREFIDIDQYSPIPCCPDHIVGNMNLRGEIMTLIDIRSTLQVESRKGTIQKAVIIRAGDVVAGAVIDEVHDTIELSATAMNASVLQDNPFIIGTVVQENQVVSVLNTEKLLLSPDLVVDAT